MRGCARATLECPSTRSLPALGKMKPITSLTKVLLPAPFSPTRPKDVPAAISRSRLSSAKVELRYRLVSFAHSITLPTADSAIYGSNHEGRRQTPEAGESHFRRESAGGGPRPRSGGGRQLRGGGAPRRLPACGTRRRQRAGGEHGPTLVARGAGER